MRIVTKVVTDFDGEFHKDQEAALRHLDRIYGNRMCKICGKLAQMEYAAVTVFVDENLDLFAELINLKKDMQMKNGEEGD